MTSRRKSKAKSKKPLAVTPLKQAGDSDSLKLAVALDLTHLDPRTIPDDPSESALSTELSTASDLNQRANLLVSEGQLEGAVDIYAEALELLDRVSAQPVEQTDISEQIGDTFRSRFEIYDWPGRGDSHANQTLIREQWLLKQYFLILLQNHAAACAAVNCLDCHLPFVLANVEACT